MTAKKSAKKAKTAPKKKAAKTAVKKAAKKGAKKGAKKAAKKPAKAAADVPAPAEPDSGKSDEPAVEAGEAVISSLSINMGHVFALRPRVTTSFKAGDFSAAKHQLSDEAYSDIQQAAKAVAEKALELTHGIEKRGRGRRR